MLKSALILALVAMLVFVVACRPKSGGGGRPVDAGSMSALLDRLESLGFYKYASTDATAAARSRAAGTAFIFGDEAMGRAFHADAEDLAEAGVGEFLKEIEPALKARGVKALTVTENPEAEDGGYRVTINGRSYEMYSGSELASGNLWQLTVERAFAAVNHLLANAGSNERIYWLYGGNDNLAVFLTEAQHGAIVESGLLDAREIPTPVGLPTR